MEQTWPTLPEEADKHPSHLSDLDGERKEEWRDGGMRCTWREGRTPAYPPKPSPRSSLESGDKRSTGCESSTEWRGR